ncbi:MAG: hypothetical protein V1772_01680 [Chloroflexota bacterium]
MKVLVATRESAVFDALRGAPAVEDTIIALVTGKVYEAVPDVQLVIIDYDDLIPHPFSTEMVHGLLRRRKQLVVCSSAEFLEDPQRYLGARYSRERMLPLPEPKIIAFTSYSGGTGKTTLALDTAFHFAQETGEELALPVGLFECTYGGSALQALLNLDGQRTVHDLASRGDLQPAEFSGMLLYPMDYPQVRLLSSDRVLRYLKQQINNHVLTVIDTSWPHGLMAELGSEVYLWIVVTTPRIDAVDNARRLLEELRRDYGEGKVILAVNQMGGLGASLALMGTPRAIEFPQLQSSGALFDGRLGRQVLSYAYPGLWPQYLRKRKRRLWPFARRREASQTA